MPPSPGQRSTPNARERAASDRGARPWPVRLTAAAEADFEDILRWTVGRFGVARARIYAETLSRALEALAGGPNVIGAKARDDIGKGILTLHVAREGYKGGHFVTRHADFRRA